MSSSVSSVTANPFNQLAKLVTGGIIFLIIGLGGFKLYSTLTTSKPSPEKPTVITLSPNITLPSPKFSLENSTVSSSNPSPTQPSPKPSPENSISTPSISSTPEISDRFIVRQDGRVYTKEVSGNWRQIGGFFPPGSPVSAVARKPGIIDLFVVGNNKKVYTSYSIDGGSNWSGINDDWQQIGGEFPPGAPVSAVARKPEIIDLFVVGYDGRVYTSWWTEKVNKWSGIDHWLPIAGEFPPGTPVSAVARNPGRLDLFVNDEDGRVYTSYFVEGVSQQWSNWQVVP
ncbi:hypothetical protein [Nostoc sp. CMAA1605]|uniref:hypothetical protein n=1 Tax=Nostoc sp. CMAA1605 TaxID=2055159 RepID=UPI001F1628DF|nr:hypothetical protein [Nostoc sp. CMAA1605]